MRHVLLKGTIIGVFSGVLLGVLFKWIEKIADLKVYTLLLNVDYLDFITNLNLNEFGDFSLHLIVSIILVIAIMILIQIKKWNAKQIVWHVIWINALIGILLYPMTTVLSDRTPDLFDIGAFSWWTIGHVLYGIVLGVILKSESSKNRKGSLK